MQDKRYFCHEIYNNISIWSFNGQVRYNPCCLFTGYTYSDDVVDITNAWNSKKHIEIKQLISNNESVPGCHLCYRDESNGLVSRRMGADKLYTEYLGIPATVDADLPVSIEYSVGNLCNLKCMSCGPQSSSSWVSDYLKLNPGESATNFKYNKHSQVRISNLDVLKNIKHVHFHGGGEPLMSSDHILLLENIRKSKGLSDVRVTYNTNATIRVSSEVLKLWEECRLVELYFSIDSIGQRFEYIRTNAIWDEVLENLKWYKAMMPSNHLFKINCVWSYLNFYYLDELLDWYADNFSTNRLGDKTEFIFQQANGKLQFSKVSNDIYTILSEKFQRYPAVTKLLNSLDIKDNDHATALNYIKSIDNIRLTKFNLVNPEWAKLLAF